MENNAPASIEMRDINRTFKYRNKAMVNFTAGYPHIGLPGKPFVEKRINRSYSQRVNDFYRYTESVLYRQAVRFYKDTLENNFPFNPFDAVMKDTVTLNDGEYLSSYNDRYEYTGGAHGSTLRTSDTFNMNNGVALPLSYFFPPNSDYREIILTEILRQAEENIKENPYIYFENYPELIVKNFSPRQYYLTEEGIVIYYQQYDIGPYASGIQEFTIPYNKD